MSGIQIIIFIHSANTYGVSCLNFRDEACLFLSLGLSDYCLHLYCYFHNVSADMSPVFFRCFSNSGTYTEFLTTSFIETTRVTCSDSVSHNRIQVLSIPVLLLVCCEDWTCNLQMIVALEAYRTNAYNRYAYNRYATGPAGQFRVNYRVRSFWNNSWRAEIWNSDSRRIQYIHIYT